MGEKKDARKRARLGAAIVRFMDKKFECRVVVVDSIEAPGGIAVLREDGALLSREQAVALGHFIRGYRVFGGPS
ncbi:hypothetical protein VB1_CDS0065 [Arthrobacter phage Marchesin]|nr:hypothetical protein VB1_CDS0065 [Arthrobacter phage Marchesin]